LVKPAGFGYISRLGGLMAKRQTTGSTGRGGDDAPDRGRGQLENKIEDFAEDLGRLLGSAQAKAEGWLGQRKQISTTLEGIRDTASNLLNQLGHKAASVAGRGGRRGRPPGVSRDSDIAAAPLGKRKRRKLSAAARKAISDAQKARWAKQRRSEKS
jgi:hypothetical protein